MIFFLFQRYLQIWLSPCPYIPLLSRFPDVTRVYPCGACTCVCVRVCAHVCVCVCACSRSNACLTVSVLLCIRAGAEASRDACGTHGGGRSTYGLRVSGKSEFACECQRVLSHSLWFSLSLSILVILSLTHSVSFGEQIGKVREN